MDSRIQPMGRSIGEISGWSKSTSGQKLLVGPEKGTRASAVSKRNVTLTHDKESFDGPIRYAPDASIFSTDSSTQKIE